MLQSLTAGFILSNINYVVLQGLVLVYVTVVLVVMARQFSFLPDTEDMEKMMVVNSEGVTNMETLDSVISDNTDMV